MRGLDLLTTGNPKVAKGLKDGYWNAVLHLAPSNLSGVVNVCPNATKGCRAGCLNTAGRGGIIKAGQRTNAIQECRTRRTEWYAFDIRSFTNQLAADIENHRRNAADLGLQPVVRLNGTSDIDWYSTGHAWFILDAASRGVIFYDYTKRGKLFETYAAFHIPIHLTFSRAETDANKRVARAMMEQRNNVAVVFSTKKGKALPATFEGVPVIDGDVDDNRFRDPRGVVVGLRAKGRARKDATGFVVQV